MLGYEAGLEGDGMTEEEREKVQQAIESMCQGRSGFTPIDLANTQWVTLQCKDCGQIIRYGTTVSVPSWSHYKPGQQPPYAKLQRRAIVEKRG